ncbi:unnamed protein product [Cyclocybe aegerita]|uniref:F-box domain-containing protein n=1 Tax=Cyclocybe aegerita TaxID=1973307 RepID=A0A8S0VVH1_CYCAE|nr:unnamed protein product [Cyclocybe aegerita]
MLLSLSPISSLSQDLLYSIFSLNADLDQYYGINEDDVEGFSKYPALYEDEDTEDEQEEHTPYLKPLNRSSSPIQTSTMQSRSEYLLAHPLSVLRRASQVCSVWRGVILSAPVLWGRIVDIDILFVSHQDWSAEVLSRTQDALLHIRARREGHRLLPCQILESNPELVSRYLRFISKIIQKNWGRIRKLDVDCNKKWMSVRADRRRFSTRAAVVRNPTDVLEYFKLKLENVDVSFTHSAAKIRHFYSSGATFSLHAPWVATLHTLKLDTFYPLWSISEFIVVLQSMQDLKKLYLGVYWKDDDRVGDSILKTHPAAKHLHLNDVTLLHFSAANCTAILEAFVPIDVCRLHVDTSYPESEADLRAFRNVVQKFAANRQFGKYLSLDVSFSTGKFDIVSNDPTGNTVFRLFMDHHFGMPFTGVPDQMRDGFVEELFRIFAQGNFSQTRCLVLPKLFSLSQAWPESLTALHLLLRALSRVNVIRQDGFAMSGLHRLAESESSNEGVFLPSLRRIMLQDCQWKFFSTFAKRFYVARMQRGQAPPVLDIGLLYQQEDMSELNDIYGLQLVYIGADGDLCSYTCGAAWPDSLGIVSETDRESYRRLHDDSEKEAADQASWIAHIASRLGITVPTTQQND